MLIYTAIYSSLLVSTGLYSLASQLDTTILSPVPGWAEHHMSLLHSCYFILIYTGLYWFVLVYAHLAASSILQASLQYLDNPALILAYCGPYHAILVYTSLHRFIPVHTGSYCSILVSTHLAATLKSPSLLQHLDDWGIIQVYYTLCYSVLVYTSLYWFILVRTHLAASLTPQASLQYLEGGRAGRVQPGPRHWPNPAGSRASGRSGCRLRSRCRGFCRCRLYRSSF